MKHIPVRYISTTPKEIAAAESFSIREVGDLLAGKNMEQELHRHDFFYILVLKKGAGQHEIDFKPCTIGDNTIFLMRPGQVHQLVLKAGSTGYLLQFRDDFYFPHNKVSSQLLRKAGQINHYQPDKKQLLQLLPILKAIFQEYTGKQDRYQDAIRANMDLLFIELVRQYNNTPSDDAGLYMQEQLEAFSALLETHVVNHKQVAQYAAMLHLSTYQLNAITKATLGKTCSALINEYIILEAKRYLLATSNQVNQIADRLGYEDVSYFIRFFKKHTGHSPEAFRQDFK